MAAPIWRSFPCDRRQVRLDTVLICGQSFRWRENKAGEWLGVIANKIWRLKQDDAHIYYQVYESAENSQTEKVSNKKDGSRFEKRNDETQSAVKCETDSETVIKEEQTEQSKLSKSPCVSAAALNNTHAPPLDPVKIKTEKSYNNDSDTKYCSILRDYFQLDVDLEKLYRQWCASDAYFKKTAADFWGVRMLRQDPVENLFSFICSSNNHISRISSMVEKLCENYGSPIAVVDGKMYHSFPSVSSLAVDGVEGRLRELGFGYRAKFIATSARYIIDNHGEDWVASLRQQSYEEAKVELMKLCGVGAKVADCVCLMSLDKPGALPVDTHVWQFAARHYLPKLQNAKSVTDKLYQEIGDYFRKLWGEYAGWAHSVLFTAELRHMQDKKSSAVEVKQEAAKVIKAEVSVENNTKIKRSRTAPSLRDSATSDHVQNHTKPKRSKTVPSQTVPTGQDLDQKHTKLTKSRTDQSQALRRTRSRQK